MDLVVEELDQLKRKLEITIPEEVVTQRINSAYSELNQQMRMPGFRPGKIPQNILEKQVPVQSFTTCCRRYYRNIMKKPCGKAGSLQPGPPRSTIRNFKMSKRTPL